MSSSSQTAAPSSIFKSMLDTALAEYQKKTRDDLLAHWLAAELQACESVDGVLNILRDQAKAFEQSGDQKLMKWIDPLVHVLYTFSGALGDGVSLAFPPAKVIFTGIGVLLNAAKDVRASHGAIIDLFERIESFFKRLEVYTEISLSTKMAEVLVKIVIELLSILSIATKEVKRRRAKIYFRKLLGRTDIEDALKKLDSLIQEEFQMVTAQILKVTTEAKDDASKANMVMQQDMEEVKRDVLEVKRDVVEVKSDVEEVKWTQIEQDIHKWFSPPDPSTNYNIACEAHQEGTAEWFFRGEEFKHWSSISSLLWIHGKPGSGKSILCSAIIKYVISLRDAGQAALAFFYFDFRDKDKKQDFRNFITSLLVQLSANSTLCCEIIFRIYSTHGKGARQPSNGALTDCLRKMLSIAAEQPIYIIVDALDECPNASGMPTPREVVLDLLERLVRLDLPNLHICVTSRPEIDIKKVLGPLASAVSIHDEIGQRNDISDYVCNVVHADRKMRTWRDEEKKLVVEELSNKADGMFRWVFCQLEVLRHCFPANIRQTLRELPESLDETYARVLKEINKTNQGHAHRMLQCLMVAVRPLFVEELAELLAFEFDGAQGGIPKYRASWRLGDQTQAVLSTCSSLITIVSERWSDRQVVQFSHFSVKEFLMSDRLTSALGDFSHYHIRSGSAHTLLTQACLGSLLHLDDPIDEESLEMFPLVEYAAEHWVEHAQFEDVASRVKDGMETLFDSDKPHFAAWIGTYDIDYNDWDGAGPNANPLYYSTLCGFYDLAKHLAIKHPQYVNAVYGVRKFPLLAALSEDHAEIVELLLDHGADINVRGSTGKTLLHLVFSESQIERINDLVGVVKFLLEHGAEVNRRDNHNQTPLHLAISWRESQPVRILLEHGADAKAEDIGGKTPLHRLSESYFRVEGDVLDLALLLLKLGAEVNRRDKENQTPLHLAIRRRRPQLARTLLEHGADANAGDNNDKTPFHILSEWDFEVEGDAFDLALLLLKLGAEVNRRDKENQTPLHLAIQRGRPQLAQTLLEHGADANAEDNNGKTPLHILSESQIKGEGDVLDLARRLLMSGAEVNRRDKNNQTPLHLAVGRDRSKLARILLENDADADAKNNNGKTPLCILSEKRINDQRDFVYHARLLLEHGVGVNRHDEDNDIPLLLGIDAITENKMGETSVQQVSRDQYSSRERSVGVARRSLERGADLNVQDENQITPSHLQSNLDQFQIAILLIDHGANLTVGKNGGDSETPLYQDIEGGNVQNKNHLTPLHLASLYGWVETVRVQLDRGATANSEDNLGRTPLHLVAKESSSLGHYGVRVARLLLEKGADVDAQCKDNATPLHLASCYGSAEMVRVLLDWGANSESDLGGTLLHLVAGSGRIGTLDDVRVQIPGLLLLEHDADVNGQDKGNTTPLHVASYHGRVDVVQMLLDHGATANLEGNLGQTPLHLVAGSRYYPVQNSTRIAKLLLENGADVNAQDKDNITPLQAACYLGKVEMVRLLLDCGAAANSEISPGRTLLHLVAEGVYRSGYNGARITELLLEHGADVNAQDKENTTPLHLASYFGNVEISQVLLDRGANANSKRKLGRTPLHLVAEGKHVNGVRITGLLLERGADVNARDKDNTTPLHLASFCGRVEIAQVLLDRGAIPHSEDDLGRTPMHLAVEGLHNFGHDGVGIAQLLLEHGTDANAQDKHNTTPLHLASYCGKIEIAQVLLDRGANANATNALGQTPLHMVSRGAYSSQEDGAGIAQLLLEHGANVNAQDENHATPSDLASYHGRTELATLLLHYDDKADANVDQGSTLRQLGSEGMDHREMPEHCPSKA